MPYPSPGSNQPKNTQKPGSQPVPAPLPLLEGPTIQPLSKPSAESIAAADRKKKEEEEREKERKKKLKKEEEEKYKLEKQRKK